METIFVNVITRAKAQAKGFGGNVESGSAAIAQAGGRPAPRDISAAMFADGDVIEVPAWPVEGTPQESDAQWMCKPLSRGGDPVLSVFCKCISASGVTSVKELFAGTLVKNQVNAETQATEASSGTARQAVEGLPLVEDVFKTIAGKKLKFSNPKTFKVVRRDFNGVRPDRIANSTVFQIDIVD